MILHPTHIPLPPFYLPQKADGSAIRLGTIRCKPAQAKEYANATIQHDVAVRIYSTQTDPELCPALFSSSIQTDAVEIAAPESAPVAFRLETQTQTNGLEPDASRFKLGFPPDEDGDSDPEKTLASLNLSSTSIPPISIMGQDRGGLVVVRIADQSMKKRHSGLRRSSKPTFGGLLEDAIDSRKEGLAIGVGCGVVNPLVEESIRMGSPRPETDRQRRRGQLYSIYTYGEKKNRSGSLLATVSAHMFILYVGVLAVVTFLVGSVMTPRYHNPSGSASYHDRAAWRSLSDTQTGGM